MSLSRQVVPLETGAATQPVAGLHEYVVHRLPSSHTSTVPAAQEPARHVSAPLHALPSLQAVPFVTGVVRQPSTASQESVVNGLPSLQTSAVPAAHEPAWQVSVPLHGLPSPQAVPFAIQRVSGRLTTREPQEARLLARAIHLQDGAGVRVGLGSGAALAVTVTPATRESGAAIRVFAVPLDTGLKAEQPQRGLERAFGLSSSEARVAVCIATGMTPKEAAEDLGIAVSTARTHLLRAFEKTGVRRQADLVGLITRMAQIP